MNLKMYSFFFALASSLCLVSCGQVYHVTVYKHYYSNCTFSHYSGKDTTHLTLTDCRTNPLSTVSLSTDFDLRLSTKDSTDYDFNLSFSIKNLPGIGDSLSTFAYLFVQVFDHEGRAIGPAYEPENPHFSFKRCHPAVGFKYKSEYHIHFQHNGNNFITAGTIETVEEIKTTKEPWLHN